MKKLSIVSNVPGEDEELASMILNDDGSLSFEGSEAYLTLLKEYPDLDGEPDFEKFTPEQNKLWFYVVGTEPLGINNMMVGDGVTGQELRDGFKKLDIKDMEHLPVVGSSSLMEKRSLPNRLTRRD